MTPLSEGANLASHLMELLLSTCNSPATHSSSKKKSIFQNIEELISEPTTSSQDKLECPLCSKAYVTFFGLRRHLKSHVDGRIEQKCPHCSKHYKSAGALKMHLNTHSLPCSCAICGKNFSRPWLLKVHLRVHSGEKPYECLECGRSFADKSNLRAHEQTHSAVKKHRCGRCNTSFARLQLMHKHAAVCTKQPRQDTTTSS